MNERILKLALDSGLLNYVDNETPAHYFVYYNATGEDVQKFAESIIKECAQVCKTVGGDQIDNASKEYQEGREMGTEVCYNMIRKHFGVE